MNPEELRRIAILKDLNDDARARLAAALEDKQFAGEETIFAEGDPGDSMYFIVQGSVRIEKRGQAAGSSPKTLAVLETGDYFGEMALLEGKPRSGAAVASGPARLLRLPKQAFEEIRKESSAAAMSVLFDMVRTSSERIRRLSTHMVVYDEVGKAIGEARDLQMLLDVILQQLATASNADWGLLLFRRQFSEGFEVRSQANLALTTEQHDAIANGKGFVGLMMGNPQDLVLPDCDADESFKSCPRLGFETASLLAATIRLQNELLGLIVLGGEKRGQFDQNALNLVRGVARQAAQAILNARHREEEQARSRHGRQFVRF
ncbi:MAG TPA: cyclic nucleotide-binding domain-containing protein [Candidatus Limnocylindrales bacterium]|jgi:CRP-like cAMP-binding protein|nr:cyclic nucleotide-binding domain-containing protein [Candidatus Limnocylindrales bacterium]